MHIRKPHKHLLFSLLFLIGLALMVLSSSLSHLEPISGGFPGNPRLLNSVNANSMSKQPFFSGSFFYKILFVCIGILMLASLILNLLHKKGRRLLFNLICFLLIIYVLRDRLATVLHQFAQMILEIKASTNGTSLTPVPIESDMPSANIQNPSAWIVIAVSICLSALAIGLILFMLSRYFKSKNHRLFDDLVTEAKKSVKAFRAGLDIREGVIHCYHEMNRVLDEKNGIRREETMTAREFEEHLRTKGLVQIHFKQLTRLFEKVRYGAKKLTLKEEKNAVECLTAIIALCEKNQR